MRVSIRIQNQRALAVIETIKRAIDSGAHEIVYEKVAWKTHRNLVEVTPVGYTKLLRKNWAVARSSLGNNNFKWSVFQRMPRIFGYLEEGTPAHGPVTAKFLYIPLTAAASINGWDESQIFGVDYILKKRVRGIRARHYVKKETRVARRTLKAEMRQYIRALINLATANIQ